ncbi:hypothetical protein [Brevundimonas sp. SORGH_AS_0993]|uniref:hypothetical protein n=1 Tax=Brevundimonas sp. SORGH_AS_0993 TaxID=3041794 RepID=UPI0027D86BC6|nr:hypothetical protein [Brevundimonas sp. SORGH_AS_0993]
MEIVTGGGEQLSVNSTWLFQDDEGPFVRPGPLARLAMKVSVEGGEFRVQSTVIDPLPLSAVESVTPCSELELVWEYLTET